MPFQKVTTEKLSQAAVQQIELLILRGILRPGDKLPPERDLAQKMGISRPSLREALSELQDGGLLSAKQGAGIYVADVLGSAFSPALVKLMADHRTAEEDYLSFRKDMEGLAAFRAATLGSDADLKVIKAIFEKMAKADATRSNDDDARLDAEFHMAIIEASHNVVMLHMMRSMYELLQNGVFYNRQATFLSPTGRSDLMDQHRAINLAIQNRDPEAAKSAVEAHLDYVADMLARQHKQAENEQIARLRFEQEGER